MAIIIRYVITHLCSGIEGRQLAEPMQGRFTYATQEEAQQRLDAIVSGTNAQALETLFNMPLAVRPCECYPRHFDPIGRYFPD